MQRIKSLLILFSLGLASCVQNQVYKQLGMPRLNWEEAQVKPEQESLAIRLGSDLLFEEPYFSLVCGKRVGIMANRTSLTTVDRLLEEPELKLVAIFAPEHGLDGRQPAGTGLASTFYRGVPVYACYGDGDASRRIKGEYLEGLEVLLFELQDLGTRHYTYISSMYLAMDSAADCGIPFVVLDRPVAVGGGQVEGPVLEPENQSFVGIGRLPNRYGMTIGELALLFKNEPALMDGPRYPRAKPTDPYSNLKDLKLYVVPMRGYRRWLCYDEQLGIPPWIPPSPNIPSVTAALCYVGTGLFEGNPIQAMVAGFEQFSYLAFPFIKTEEELKAYLELARSFYDFPGLDFEIMVNPQSGKKNVVRLLITDRRHFNATYTALAMLYAQLISYPQQGLKQSGQLEVILRRNHGTAWLAQLILQKDQRELPTWESLLERLKTDEEWFKAIRAKYLLY